jgi:hypothetical protein
MRVKTNMLAATSLLAIISGCAEAPLPNNAITATHGSGNYLESVDFSYQSGRPIPFSQVKLCVAKTISDDAVSLGDTAGSFASNGGQYYQNNRTQVIQGGGVFKYVDDANSTLIAKGTVSGGAVAFGLTTEFVKFELEAAVRGNAVTLSFSKISRAQQNTGTLGNDGFSPVGTWSGAGSKQVYDAVEGVADKIKGCLR